LFGELPLINGSKKERKMFAVGKSVGVKIITATSVENLQKMVNDWLKNRTNAIFDIKYSDSGSPQGARSTVSSSFSAMIIYGRQSDT